MNTSKIRKCLSCMADEKGDFFKVKKEEHKSLKKRKDGFQVWTSPSSWLISSTFLKIPQTSNFSRVKLFPVCAHECPWWWKSPAQLPDRGCLQKGHRSIPDAQTSRKGIFGCSSLNPPAHELMTLFPEGIGSLWLTLLGVSFPPPSTQGLRMKIAELLGSMQASIQALWGQAARHTPSPSCLVPVFLYPPPKFIFYLGSCIRSRVLTPSPKAPGRFHLLL